ncbi:aldehyde dehydrogenase family protein [Sulfuritalea hydrogenivorans]|uniref:NAD-dependent aldehyde dehydrogenase n=1 Tax=Sulfuritalea hydrogenivorans sk43H TaxID=1223802 RepID=W0SDX6_9PROT|nr:aldehyde dehydrogenase family protein [Sulfuritalea hydrogenivorans]BAO28975.1 NAD-dependent aldehyde dehydrogenase [Sulfuritalea hydrogenivorans sk43H]
MEQRTQFYIDGQWVSPAGQGTIEVFSPTDGALLATVPQGNAADADKAVTAARGAFDAWSVTPAAERAAYLKKIQESLKARADEIAKTITLEMGMPYKFSQRIQVGSPTASFGMYSKMLADFPFEEKVGNSKVVREAVGVVAAITPWNYPLHQIAAKVAAALAAGCTVVLKPSEVAPLNAFLLAEIIHAAGVPAGVFNLITGYGPVVGEAMVTHREVDMVSFTGSTRAGTRVSELASATVKRVALELGGKSAAIILDDADFNVAVKGVVGNCYLNSGQTCTAHTRMLVPATRYAEAAKLAVEAAQAYRVGDPMAEGVTLGPLASKMQQDRVRDYIGKGIAEGCELLTGGADLPEGVNPDGYYVKPTIFGKVKPDSSIAQEEIFGPVLSIISYADEEDAVSIANGTVYGLAGGVWSATDEHAEQVARRMRTGQVEINGGTFNMYAPFGGYKQSGNGRELGKYGLEDFLEFKAMQFRPAPKG